MNKASFKTGNAHGFTIVELLIATGIFSVMLLLITLAVIQISRVYYKGIVTTDTQNTTRQIMDTISQAVQFSGGTISSTPPDGTTQTPGANLAFCIGDKRFSYTVGRQLYDGPSDATAKRKPHVLVVDEASPDCVGSPTARNLDAYPVTLPTGSRELLSPGMRLTNLRVYNVGDNLYRITVRVVSGDSDLLNDPDSETAACKESRYGTQFCAISEMSTVVTKRISNTP